MFAIYFRNLFKNDFHKIIVLRENIQKFFLKGQLYQIAKLKRIFFKFIFRDFFATIYFYRKISQDFFNLQFL